MQQGGGQGRGTEQEYSIPNNYNINGTPLRADPVDKYVITIDNLTIFVYAEFCFMLARLVLHIYFFPGLREEVELNGPASVQWTYTK